MPASSISGSGQQTNKRGGRTVEFAGGGRLDIRITPADLGKRVSVRRVAEIVQGRPVFSDTVGVLTSWSGGVLMITRRTGEVVRITESSLVAGKAVPGAPAVRRGPAAPAAGVRELQTVAARGWPAPESERLGGWTLRAAVVPAAPGDPAGPRGFTRRANSVLPLGDPGLPLDAALERVTGWYGARGLVPYVQVATGSPDGDERLAAALDDRGWTREGATLLLTAPLDPVADAPGAERVVTAREPDDAWLRRYRRTGTAVGTALAVLRGGPSVWFATVPGEPGEPPAAIGRCVVDGVWAGFAAVEVDPALRRQGLATAVMAALARRAVAEGARGAYLQVEEDNGSARALYERMGFGPHHHYHYRRAPRSTTD
nr:GNAT family N-acetyltransferase [Streptomyces sp. SID5468]